MALIKYSLFYYRHFNPFINKQPKVFFGWLNVNLNQTQVRLLRREANEKVVEKFKKKDDIAGDYKLFYRAPFEIYCKVCYSLALFSSTVLPTLFSSMLFTHGFGNYPLMLGGMELVRSDTDLLLFGGGLMITIALVGCVIFRYPYRIYRNSSCNKYIMVYQNILPWKIQKEELNMGELRKTEKSFMPWHDSLYEFKNRKAILLDNCFLRPYDLELMMKAPSVKDPE